MSTGWAFLMIPATLIATAEAIFDAVAPKGLTSASHPFKVWTDQTQKHFLELARLYQ